MANRDTVTSAQREDARSYLGEVTSDSLEPIMNLEVEPIDSDTVAVFPSPLRTVKSVRLVTDVDKDGTNYYTGGSFVARTGEITLGTSLPSGTEVVMVDYVLEKGPTNDDIDKNIKRARKELEWELKSTAPWDWATNDDFPAEAVTVGAGYYLMFYVLGQGVVGSTLRLEGMEVTDQWKMEFYQNWLEKMMVEWNRIKKVVIKGGPFKLLHVVTR